MAATRKSVETASPVSRLLAVANAGRGVVCCLNNWLVDNVLTM